MEVSAIKGSLERDGYAIVDLGLSPDLIKAAANEVAVRAGYFDPNGCSLPVESKCFVPIWNSEALWRIRSDSALPMFFSEILGSSDLWVSFDRCHFKPTWESHPSLGLSWFLHWDDNVSDPLFHRFQGVLALTDNPAYHGNFACSPEVFREYVANGAGAARRLVASGCYSVLQLACRAGELIVWDHRLLHGNSPNLGSEPRIAMYLTMDLQGTAADLSRRSRHFRDGTWPGGKSRYPGFDEERDSGPSLESFPNWLGVEQVCPSSAHSPSARRGG